MKVIKEARDAKNFTANCRNCGSTLLVEEADVRAEWLETTWGTDLRSLFAYCPVCTLSTNVSARIPPLMKLRILDRKKRANR